MGKKMANFISIWDIAYYNNFIQGSEYLSMETPIILKNKNFSKKSSKNIPQEMPIIFQIKKFFQNFCKNYSA